MIRRSKEQWLALIQQQAESGLPAVQFCKQQNICDKHFSLRKKQLRDASPATQSFVRIQRARETVSVNAHENTAPSMMLRCGPSALYFNSTPNVEWLAKLMKQLA